MNSKLLRQLQAVDWDFPHSDVDTSSAIHWYPGTFPSQMPSTLVEALAHPNSIVFDPYAGIGTTGVESLRLGKRAWCVDQSPIGCLASYVMSGLILSKAIGYAPPSPSLIAVEKAVLKLQTQSDLFTYAEDPSLDRNLTHLIRPTPAEMYSFICQKMPPKWNLLEPWFESNTLQSVKKCLNRLHSSDISAFAKLIGLLMISSSLRTASSQNKSWGHIADNVLPDNYEHKDFMELCKRWLSRTRSNIAKTNVTQLSADQQKVIRMWISCHDWRSEIKPIVHPHIKCDILITSPPYSGAIDYSRAQRLSLYMLGYSNEDITLLGKQEIGARRKRSSSVSESTWATELAFCLLTQLYFLAPIATAAIVLPHEDHGRKQGSMRLGEIFYQGGWQRVISIDRSIRQIRTRQSWTSIKRETLEIFEKGQ
jgi:hypothetical protein